MKFCTVALLTLVTLGFPNFGYADHEDLRKRTNQIVTMTSPAFPIQTPTGTTEVYYYAQVFEASAENLPSITAKLPHQLQFSNLGAPPESAQFVRDQLTGAGIQTREPVAPIPGPHVHKYKVVGSKLFLTLIRVLPAGVWTVGMLQNAAFAAGQKFSLFPMESLILSPNFHSAVNVGLSVAGLSALLFVNYDNTVAKFTDYRGFTGLLASKMFREFAARHDKMRRALGLPKDLQPVESSRTGKFTKYWLTEQAFYGAILYCVALNGFALPNDIPLLEAVKAGGEFLGLHLAGMEPAALLAFHIAFTSALSTWFQGSWDLGIIRQMNAMISKYAGDPLEQEYHRRVARIKWTLTSLAQVAVLALGNFGVLSPTVTQAVYVVLGAFGVAYFLKQFAKFKDVPVEAPMISEPASPQSRSSCQGAFKQSG